MKAEFQDVHECAKRTYVLLEDSVGVRRHWGFYTAIHLAGWLASKVNERIGNST